MSEREFKPGDRVLVEAVADLWGDGKITARFTDKSGSWPLILRQEIIHPLPAFVLEEVDVNCGEPEYPTIEAEDVQIGDVVRVTNSPPSLDLVVYGVKGNQSWVAGVWSESSPFTAQGHPWILITRDGVDQGKRKRMRYCDLPEGKYVEQWPDGEWYGANQFETEIIPSDHRVFRVVEVK